MEGPTTSLTLLGRLRHTSDEEAWREFVAIYCPMVYRLARKKGLDAEAADGVVQSFCVKMVQSLPGFRYDPTRGRFRKWILTIALNEIRDLRRQQARCAHERQELETAQRVLDGPAREIDTWWDAAEQEQMLQLAIEELRGSSSSRHFRIFEMTVLGEASAEETAAANGVTAAYVYGVKFRMLQQARVVARRISEAWDDSAIE